MAVARRLTLSSILVRFRPIRCSQSRGINMLKLDLVVHFWPWRLRGVNVVRARGDECSRQLIEVGRAKSNLWESAMKMVGAAKYDHGNRQTLVISFLWLMGMDLSIAPSPSPDV